MRPAFDHVTVNGRPIGDFRPIALSSLDERDNRVFLPVFWDTTADVAVWKP